MLKIGGEGWLSEDRPLTVGAAWRLALVLYRKNFFVVFGIALIASLLEEFLLYLFTSESQSPPVGLLASMPGSIAAFFGFYALATAILDRLQHRSTGVRDAYGFVLYYPLPFAALALLYLDIRRDRGEL